MADLLVVIVGPTAVGKTALAVQLAKAQNGEIVSADSRQIYRGMDIGTAKPSADELAQVPHHLIDAIDPDEDFSLAEFQEQAYAAIDEILARHKLPFLVGGTGQYTRAVVEGWRIPRVPPDAALRVRLYAEAEEHGPQHLYERLIALDPEAADFVDARNVRRVIRALEVIDKSGRPFSEQRRKRPPPYDVLQIGLTMDREALYRRIDARIDAMLAQGLVREVQQLLERGYDWSLPAMSSLGYLQLKGYFEGTISLEEAVALIKKETRRFIRHQYNWFRLDDPEIHWLDATESPVTAALDLIQQARDPLLARRQDG